MALLSSVLYYVSPGSRPHRGANNYSFLIHLSYYCKYSTVINYLSAINVLHRHFGFNVMFQEVFSIKLILRGLWRILGDAPVQKLPITPDILLRLYPQFTARSDSGFWAAMLIGFYTFFRKSNLVPKSEKDFDPTKNLCRHDIVVRPWGLVFAFVGQKRFNSESVSYSFPFCGSPKVTLSASCTPMNVTF